MGESVDELSVTSGDDFAIKLESNPTTGYSWQPIYDDTYVKLISNDFVQATKLMGGGAWNGLFFELSSQETQI